jgi:hypothetical protein
MVAVGVSVAVAVAVLVTVEVNVAKGVAVGTTGAGIQAKSRSPNKLTVKKIFAIMIRLLGWH